MKTDYAITFDSVPLSDGVSIKLTIDGGSIHLSSINHKEKVLPIMITDVPNHIEKEPVIEALIYGFITKYRGMIEDGYVIRNIVNEFKMRDFYAACGVGVYGEDNEYADTRLKEIVSSMVTNNEEVTINN